jgi:protoporphyrinogen/coproporphyrinogen III oxidase
MRVHGAPEIVRASSWQGTMPRYTVGHLERVARAERELAAWPTIQLAGAPYHGVGLPDCISQAHGAVATVIERLGVQAALPG